ncbi:hypothetical protein JOF53_007319 [Crossiella equi]|uniref:Uncharacterized protein n=1 Tax=Crossiella equi TaxID=130796 RepID=A0ABS5APE5_9PSEU|nr:hypothetical protein [Crossiella equi]MBP2478447.1 hypothetical protein [Crossiella equi]
MPITPHRVLILLLGLSALPVGFWAYFAPEHWYANFPGFGRQWLPPLGPFNLHLVSDVGSTYLGLFVLSAFAFVHADRVRVVQLTGLAWSAFNLPHLVFHLRHLHVYQPLDQVLNVIALGTVLLLSLALLIPARRRQAVG